MPHRIAQCEFTDDEIRQLQEQRALMDARLLQEHGQEWMDANKAMLDAQWEYTISLGLFTLVTSAATEEPPPRAPKTKPAPQDRGDDEESE